MLGDLKQRGILEDTLVVWGGEFGRTPDTAKKVLDGRDRNRDGYTMWLAVEQVVEQVAEQVAEQSTAQRMNSGTRQSMAESVFTIYTPGFCT